MEGRKEGRKEGRMEGRESGVKDCLQQSKIVRFLKIKFLIILKLNYNGGQFYKK